MVVPDLELRALRAPDDHSPLAFNRSGRDEPAPTVRDKDEEEVAACRVEDLHDAIPALVAAARREIDHVTTRAVAGEAGGGLDLHPQRARPEVGDQVVVRAVTKRDEDVRSRAPEPGHGGALADVALLAGMPA